MRHQSLLVALMLLSSTTLGCGMGGGGGKKKAAESASNAAATTAATGSGAPGTIAGTTLTTRPVAPVLQTATFVDKDGTGTVTEGDELNLLFDLPLDVIPGHIDPSAELELPVPGDSLGVGAKFAQEKLDLKKLTIKLGTTPKLRISGGFDAANLKTGNPSGVRIGDKATGVIASAADHLPATTPAPIDVTGQAVGQFKPAQSMYFARGLHTANLLDDGRVLVVGGRGRKVFIPEAELFDPLASTWSRTDRLSGDKGFMKDGSMTVKRTMHASTKLKDGKVLITGGYGVKRKGWLGLYGEKEEVLDCAHVFDPKTNTFSEVGHMINARRSHQATLMVDGRVMITGGYDDSWWSLKQTTPEAEIYDPTTNKFTAAPKMIEKRMYHTATAMAGGRKVVCIGGTKYDGGNRIFGKLPKLSAAIGGDVFEGGSFTRSADLIIDRRYHAAIELSAGDVFVAGGDDGQQSLSQLERLDPNTLKFTKAGDLKTARTNPSIVRSGRDVYIAGGMGFNSGGGRELSDVEVWSEVSGTITGTIKMVEPRNSTALVELKDGRLLLIGGMTGGSKDLLSLDGQAQQSCEILERP